jgi:hypothetical protein
MLHGDPSQRRDSSEIYSSPSAIARRRSSLRAGGGTLSSTAPSSFGSRRGSLRSSFSGGYHSHHHAIDPEVAALAQLSPEELAQRMDPSVALPDAPWYLGHLDRHLTERLLERWPSNTFCVRLSKGKPVVSLNFPSGGKRFYHVRVETENGVCFSV